MNHKKPTISRERGSAPTAVGATPKTENKKELKPMSVVALVLWILLLLIVPWLYLMLCGLIFDWALQLYDPTWSYVIAGTLFAFWGVNIFVLIPVVVRRFIRSRRNLKRRGG